MPRGTPPDSQLARVLGIDRRGPAPADQLPGAPLKPLTPANMISFARLLLVPVFLALAARSGDGRAALTTLVFTVAVLSDYLDGLVARATRNYSRLGALLDPTVDRLLALAAVLVAWRFDLLPRLALAALAAHEVAVLILGAVAVRLHIHVDVSWTGRISFVLVMLGFWLAFVSATPLTTVVFGTGVAATYLAVALYARTGIAALRERQGAPARNARP